MQQYKGKKLSKARCIKQIRLYYEIADKQDIAEGMNWYKEAHKFAFELGDRHYKTIEQTAGIIAAFSPQCSWLINKSFAISFLINPKQIISSKERTLKARNILKLHNHIDIFNALSVSADGAPKTKSFYSNILQPTNNFPVTIDRHAIGVCTQKPHEVAPLADSEAKINLKQYEFFASCYREAAKQIRNESAVHLNLLPNQLQAITWTLYRRLRELKSYNPNGYMPVSNIEF